MSRKAFIGLTLFILISLVLVWGINKEFQTQLEDLNQRTEELKEEYNLSLVRMERAIRKEQVKKFKIEKWSATGYAPLDPKAKEGVCYSGDPYTTASGSITQPGFTIATGPSVPFGTLIWVEGFGWRRADDRGSSIKDKEMDICFLTQEEALSWGRKEIMVIIPEWSE